MLDRMLDKSKPPPEERTTITKSEDFDYVKPVSNASIGWWERRWQLVWKEGFLEEA